MTVTDETDSPTTTLTSRQRKILAAIQDSLDKHGYPPSIREIGDAVGLASTSSVAYQLGILQRAGYLRRGSRLPRAIGLTGHAVGGTADA